MTIKYQLTTTIFQKAETYPSIQKKKKKRGIHIIIYKKRKKEKEKEIEAKRGSKIE